MFQEACFIRHADTLRACTASLVAIEKQILVIRLRADFSKSEVSSQINQLFINKGLYCMRKEKYWQFVDLVPVFTARSMVKVTRYRYELKLKEISIIRSELFDDFYSERKLRGINDEPIDCLRQNHKSLRQIM